MTNQVFILHILM